MLEKPESACFVIADISGYTSFLNAAELDHAQDILADLMDTVVRGLRPPFRLAKFEGDAALCVFGAPVEIDDAEGAALRAARRILSVVCGGRATSTSASVSRPVR